MLLIRFIYVCIYVYTYSLKYEIIDEASVKKYGINSAFLNYLDKKASNMRLSYYLLITCILKFLNNCLESIFLFLLPFINRK